MENYLIELLRSDGSITVNKALMFTIGIKETMVFSELLSRQNYFQIREELTEDGFFYNTVDNLELGTSLSGKQQKTAIKNLQELGLILQENREDNKRYFKIIATQDLILDYVKKGKEKINELEKKQQARKDYLLDKKNSYTEKKKQKRESKIKSREGLRQNGVSRNSKKELPVTPKWSKNNTNINNTKPNNTNLFNNNKETKEAVAVDKNVDKVRDIVKETITNSEVIAILKAANNDLELIKIKYDIVKKSKYRNLVGFLIDAIVKDYKEPIKNSEKQVINLEHKTKFHNLGEERFKKYSSEDFEKIALENNKRKFENIN